MSSRESKLKVKSSASSLRRKRNASERTIKIKHSPENQLEKSVSEGFVDNTPKNSISLTPQTQSVPPNFRPYRLSLNKRLSETMTQKRLEFHMALEHEKSAQASDQEVIADTQECKENLEQFSDHEEVLPETEVENVPDTEEINENVAQVSEDMEVLETEEFRAVNVETPKENATTKQARHKLLKKLEIVEEEMQAKQKHIAKTKDLQSEISRWRQGFNTKVNDLKKSIEPFKYKFIAMNQNDINSFYESD